MLVLNAGLTQRTTFLEFDFENHEYITTVNYVSPTAQTKVI
jgi:short-subunit dehydrogenase